MADIPGLDLKLRRTAAGVTQREIAERMGVSAQFVSHIEARRVVRAATASRYVAALDAAANKGAA